MHQAKNPTPEHRAYYQDQHDQAVSKGMRSYIDAMTGYQVFTELYLKERGYCCQSGCRHCPYGFNKP